MREFFEDEFDAIAAMVGKSGKTIKEIAAHLYPAMAPGSAYAKLKDKLDPEGREHLRYGEVIELMRYCNSYEPLMYMCDVTLHDRPERSAPDVQETRLVETISQATDALTKAMRQLDLLQERTSACRSTSRLRA